MSRAQSNQSRQLGSPEKHIRVLVVDDRETICSGLAAFLFSVPDFHHIGEARDAAQAIQRSAELQPDVVILNLLLPGINGVATARAIRAASPGTQVVALLNYADEELIREALKAGVNGYLLLDCTATQLEAAIRRAHTGETRS